MASLGVWLRKSVICLNDCRNGRQASRPSQRGKWDRTDRAGVAGRNRLRYLDHTHLSGGNFPGDSARMKHSDGQTVAGQTDQARKTKRQCRRKDCWLGDAAGDESDFPHRSGRYTTVPVASLWSLCCAAVLCLAAVLCCYVPNHRAPVRIILTSCLPNPPRGREDSSSSHSATACQLLHTSVSPHPSPRGIRDSDLPKANYCASDYQGNSASRPHGWLLGCLVLPTPRPALAETFRWAALSRLARLVCLPSTQDKRQDRYQDRTHCNTNKGCV